MSQEKTYSLTDQNNWLYAPQTSTQLHMITALDWQNDLQLWQQAVQESDLSAEQKIAYKKNIIELQAHLQMQADWALVGINIQNVELSVNQKRLEQELDLVLNKVQAFLTYSSSVVNQLKAFEKMNDEQLLKRINNLQNSLLKPRMLISIEENLKSAFMLSPEMKGLTTEDLLYVKQLKQSDTQKQKVKSFFVSQQLGYEGSMAKTNVEKFNELINQVASQQIKPEQLKQMGIKVESDSNQKLYSKGAYVSEKINFYKNPQPTDYIKNTINKVGEVLTGAPYEFNSHQQALSSLLEGLINAGLLAEANLLVNEGIDWLEEVHVQKVSKFMEQVADCQSQYKKQVLELEQFNALKERLKKLQKDGKISEEDDLIKNFLQNLDCILPKKNHVIQKVLNKSQEYLCLLPSPKQISQLIDDHPLTGYLLSVQTAKLYRVQSVNKPVALTIDQKRLVQNQCQMLISFYQLMANQAKDDKYGPLFDVIRNTGLSDFLIRITDKNTKKLAVEQRLETLKTFKLIDNDQAFAEQMMHTEAYVVIGKEGFTTMSGPENILGEAKLYTSLQSAENRLKKMGSGALVKVSLNALAVVDQLNPMGAASQLSSALQLDQLSQLINEKMQQIQQSNEQKNKAPNLIDSTEQSDAGTSDKSHKTKKTGPML